MLFCYILICSIILIRQRRGCLEIEYIHKENQRFLSSSIWLFVGWTLHYFPFYGMGRILYFHHYFPAAIFSSMLTAVILDYLLNVTPVLMLQIIYSKSSTEMMSARFQSAKLIFHFVYGSFLSALAYSFYLFSPLAYGIIRLAPSATLNNSFTETSSVLTSNSDQIAGHMSEYIDYNSEQRMQSLRWMDSWEF